MNSKKRGRNSPPVTETSKRLKITSADVSDTVFNAASSSNMPKDTQEQTKKENKQRIKKLAPARPFPSVPTSVSATGPRSAHSEGKKPHLPHAEDITGRDGYKTLHLSAMGAAIPLLLQLSLALPPILPFSSDEIHTEIITGTVEVQDELIPEEEEEDITYRTRGKSTLKVTIKIGDGKSSGGPPANSKRRRQKKNT
ncbi:hypothetical protein BDP27DRAFT_1392803 [Rhodocollybia butyracea]|uniref:Uncharacterized protein n=1 Tax=Rhodocollybia butyracea TaxID=206335 RepID=A0A9P5U6U0_9AGAR|nr:hypothetical protein BDP27DRAFT_1392803 [Rhodocollybia butyracea]